MRFQFTSQLIINIIILHVTEALSYISIDTYREILRNVFLLSHGRVEDHET